MSTTETNLSDEKVQAIACRGAHAEDKNCCQTARLGRVLTIVGGFANSALVHVMMMHLGGF